MDECEWIGDLKVRALMPQSYIIGQCVVWQSFVKWTLSNVQDFHTLCLLINDNTIYLIINKTNITVLNAYGVAWKSIKLTRSTEERGLDDRGTILQP